MKNSKFVLNLVRISFNCLIIVAICSVLIMLGKTAHDFGYRIFAETAMTSQEDAEVVYVQITEDMSLKDIANTMESLGLTRSSTLFLVQLHLSDYKKSIEPGIYTVNTSMTPYDIITCLGTQEPLILEDVGDKTEDSQQESGETQGD